MKIPYASISNIILTAIVGTLISQSLLAETLWPSQRMRSPIANKVANMRGDILTVIVNETVSVTNTAQTTTNKESTINNKVNQFLFTTAASGFGTHNGELPATDISGTNEYTSGGTTTNAQTLTDRFSVMVEDVLPNGNLVIQGARKVSFSGDRQYVVLSGIIRKWDIGVDNTIQSSLIHNANLQYIAEGTITNAQKKGWLEKLNEIINPF